MYNLEDYEIVRELRIIRNTHLDDIGKIGDFTAQTYRSKGATKINNALANGAGNLMPALRVSVDTAIGANDNETFRKKIYKKVCSIIKIVSAECQLAGKPWRLLIAPWLCIAMTYYCGTLAIITMQYLDTKGMHINPNDWKIHSNEEFRVENAANKAVESEELEK